MELFEVTLWVCLYSKINKHVSNILLFSIDLPFSLVVL